MLLASMVKPREYLEQVFKDTEELNRRTILELAEPRPGACLLDLGCGDGAFTERLGERVGTDLLHGVELIDHLASAARRRGVDVAGIDLSTSPLPFEDGSIDVIHSNQVIEHLAGTDHFMAELRRMLRPGGYAIVSTNNLASLHNIVSLGLGFQPFPSHVSDLYVGIGNPLNPYEGQAGAAGQMHLRVFTGRALSELAGRHGLRTDLALTAGFYPLPPRAAKLATRVAGRWGAFLVQRYVV